MNRYLTKRSHLFLKLLRDGEDNYGIRDGIEVWVDYEEFGYKTIHHLLRYCLVRESEDSPRTFIYTLNEDGERIIDDEEFVPPIVEHMPWLRR